MVASKTEYVVDDVDVLVDFLWNEVPIGILEEAVQKLIDEGLIEIHEPKGKRVEKF